MHLITVPIGTRWSSWARFGGSAGWKRIEPTSAGGRVTIARSADQVSEGVRMTTPLRLRRIVRTGWRSSTRRPSCLARRSAIRCEPPTIRLSWAPPVVLIRRLKSPPAVAI
jgi:hypothetical protein